jgi:hypothetical protein
MRNSIVSAAHGGYAKRHSLLVLINCAMLSIIMPLSPRRDSKKANINKVLCSGLRRLRNTRIRLPWAKDEFTKKIFYLFFSFKSFDGVQLDRSCCFSAQASFILSVG